MSDSDQDNPTAAAGMFLIWFMMLVCFPALIGIGIFGAMNLTPWLWLVVAFSGASELFFISILLPKTDVEEFRDATGVYRIPVRRGVQVFGVLVGATCIVGLPILVPLFAMMLPFVVADALSSLGSLVSELDVPGVGEVLDMLASLPEAVIVLVLAFPFWLLLVRRFPKVLAKSFRRIDLVFDEDGIRDPLAKNEGALIPWSAVADARIWNVTGVRLTGDGSLSSLMLKPGKLARRLLPDDIVNVAVLNLDPYPVSAKSVVRLIKARLEIAQFAATDHLPG